METSSGPSVVLNNANSVATTFTAPTVSSDTDLKFSLTVTDDKGGNSSPSYCDYYCQAY